MSVLTRRSVIAGLSIVTSTSLAAPHVARAAPRTLRLGHNAVDLSHFGQGAIAFSKAVAADPLIGQQLSIDVHGRAELGDEPGMLKDCLAGTLDLMVASNNGFSLLVPQVGLINAPFLFRDVRQARAVLDSAPGEAFSKIARERGVFILAWGENGMRQLTSNKPVRTPQDLRGLKLRVPPSEVMLEGMRAMGADAAPLNFGLLHEALRSGQFDAQENSIASIEFGKLYEVQKYLSLTNHIYDAAPFIASADVMEDLGAPQRAALIRCAQAGAVVTRQAVDAADRDGIARLKAQGMTVLDNLDMAAFRTAAQPYTLTLRTKFGVELVDIVTGAAA
jgi:tripartite ATP-independent transporter DctP family solute receptor